MTGAVSFQNFLISRPAFLWKYQFIINPLVRNMETPVESAAPTIPINFVNKTVVTIFRTALRK